MQLAPSPSSAHLALGQELRGDLVVRETELGLRLDNVLRFYPNLAEGRARDLAETWCQYGFYCEFTNGMGKRVWVKAPPSDLDARLQGVPPHL